MTAKVRVGGLRGYDKLVRQFGEDPLRLTRACGVCDGLLDDEDRREHAASVMVFWMTRTR